MLDRARRCWRAILLARVRLSSCAARGDGAAPAQPSDRKQVGIALFGPYVLGVELASMLLLAGLVGAYHLGRREAGRRTEVDR